MKWYWYCGIAAVLLYFFAIIVGGEMYPGYSHISQDISQLTSTNSPIKDFMRIFIIYNLLVSIFGIGLYKISKNNSAKTGSIFIVAIGVLGIVIDWFPINTRGTAITSTGVGHIIIVTIVSLMTILSGFLFWWGFRNTKLKKISTVSLYSRVGFLISGPIAAINVMSPFAGLYERIPIGIFLIWILAISTILLKNQNNKDVH